MTTEAQRAGRLAPVAIFGYARAAHLRRCVESLLTNDEAPATDVVFFCDAARAPSDQKNVDEVRSYVDTVRGFGSVTIVHREENFGLARSITEGVASMLARHGRVIVVEDDLVLSPYFLRYMNDGLTLYEREDKVASIHGYCYPTPSQLPETYFLTGADCWGWATWTRAWCHFEPDGRRLLEALESRNLCRRFDFNGNFPYTDMLRDQVHGRNSSWAIRWHASCFLAGRLTLYPGRSLVHNSGFDSTGRHCETKTDYDQQVSDDPIPVTRIALQESSTAWAAIEEFFKALRPPLHRRVLSQLVRALFGSVPH
jgi:hypothetical protein